MMARSGSKWFSILALVCLGTTLLWWHDGLQVSLYSILKDAPAQNIAVAHNSDYALGVIAKPCSNEERVAHLRLRCQARKNQTSSSFSDHTDLHFYWRLLVDDRHKALYCVIPKAACTTWKTLMVNLTGAMDGKKLFVHSEAQLATVGLRYLHHFTPDEIKKRLETYFKFIIVRHPLDRIQSAYSNKVLGTNRGYYSKLYGHIISKYRTKPKEIAESEGPITLEEFMSYIAHEYPKARDRHFQSFDDLCHPCDIEYDYIAKVETLDTDTKNLLNVLLNGETSGMQPKKLNVEGGEDKADNGRLKVLSKFKDFQREMMNLYYEKFSLDFDLFGYNFGDKGEVICQSGDSKCC